MSDWLEMLDKLTLTIELKVKTNYTIFGFRRLEKMDSGIQIFKILGIANTRIHLQVMNLE